MNNIENLIYQIIRRYESKKKQLEKVQEICVHLTSDDGIDIQAELYENNICRFLIRGTRCGMTITYDTHTMELIRKPRNIKPIHYAWINCNCSDILRRLERR